MADTVAEPGSRRWPVGIILAIAEVAAVAGLLAAFTLPWFRSTAPRVDLVTLPPGYSGPFDLSWSDWHPSHVDEAVLLTFLAPFVSAAGVLARVIFRRRWTKIVLLVGFIAALIGAIGAYGERDIPLTGLATATPAVGLWLFAGAAIAGLLTTATDLFVSSGRARF